ncbi:MAG: NTP transferase domain-containing protein [Sorangiineae bacterium]|nr:NTP transferase domain-containing protein [Polyangiaceae bacterium]MEB2323853.1 NTP transferase domain-containing protein [Sorangiineae bacterium]
MARRAGISPERVGGIVLAAGASVRAGCSKALATLDGEPFVLRVARALSEGGAAEVVVVVGPPREAAIRAALSAAELVGVRAARNPAPERGMRSSMLVGLDALGAVDAALVALVDQPRVRADTIAALLGAPGAPLVRPVYAGARGHPILVRRALFAALRDAPDGASARDALAGAPAVDLDVDDPGVADRLDTLEAIRRAGGRAPGAG